MSLDKFPFTKCLLFDTKIAKIGQYLGQLYQDPPWNKSYLYLKKETWLVIYAMLISF